MWYVWFFQKKKLEVLRLLSRAVNEYESEGELCRQITNNLNKWIFEYSNWRKCQNTDIYYIYYMNYLYYISEFWLQFMQSIGFSTGSVYKCLLFTNLDIGRKYEYKCNIEIGGDLFETTKLSSHPYWKRM